MPELLKPISDAIDKLVPYRRREFRYEYDFRYSDSPPCHQREHRIHSRMYVTHVLHDGTFTSHEVGAKAQALFALPAPPTLIAILALLVAVIGGIYFPLANFYDWPPFESAGTTAK